ncbi:MAG: D-alanine--D-alanine ligase family protein [Bacteroidota bacterium]
MEKLNVAILTGGNVAERGISLLSAKTVFQHLDPEKYQPYIIELNGRQFEEQASNALIDKNDFSLDVNGHLIRFDLVFLMLHGHPAEDGSIQGYFDLLGIPYTGCDHFVSALTFNKQACKDFLRSHNIPMAPSVLIHQGETLDLAAIRQMSLPLFVKPNKNGSSYGISKVDRWDDLEAAIEKSFAFDDEVLIEGFLDGSEFSNGVIRKGQEIVALPITEIRSENDFFDYKAKYENESQEITPAELPESLSLQCQALSRRLYKVLGCRGLTRFDYILVEGTFYFLEANTIPGMSEQSIFPQQTLAHGWSIRELLDAVAEEALSRVKEGRAKETH